MMNNHITLYRMNSLYRKMIRKDRCFPLYFSIEYNEIKNEVYHHLRDTEFMRTDCR